ncbi:hypothetical protein BAY61_12115 [Prauserella marina]|uniref:Uncharacterized protein n=1 Tax=Prauserella marina TaxID=530584 RepID=A0A222VNX7_9PSEU|nr:hypothetical protein [Prauserella marina]ASR35619.1 hypothetical protein BAY61_12115 [Prauserella marina]PWV84518.1 hypothetical protein DES30_101535 [Prauserella marina]SDC20355.1 hypothetical protein SAMN05421630_101801 [Prauserella marina]
MNTVKVKGISYHVDEVGREAVRADLRVIRDQLHCTAVLLTGAGLDALAEAAEDALAAGLDVHIRPEPVEAGPSELVAHVRAAAKEAERLRDRYPGRVTFHIGNEFSLTSRGVVPGAGVFLRLQLILRCGWLFRRRITRKVGVLVRGLTAVARREFGGPVTYSAAHWEHVDWSTVDIVGVNLYRFGDDPGYPDRVRSLVDTAAGKPVVITEFGCGAHVGGNLRGAGAFLIVNWFGSRPRVRDGHVRDERVQARYLGELIRLYGETGVHGCFVFTFAMPDFPHDPDPRWDLDMAGFGVVKTLPGGEPRWERKAAFDEVASRYRRTSQ